jgi:MFS family permease
VAFDVAAHDPYAALRVRDFRRLLAGNIAVTIGMEAQGAAVGWELYERTRSPLALGMVGLVQFLPMLVLTLPAGHVADHTERRRVLIGSMLLAAVSSLGLAAVSAAQGAVLMMYAFLLLNGVARSLRGPAYQALAAQLVSRELFPNAATWRSTGFQLAAMLGPGVGGTMLAAFQLATPVYLVGAAAALLNILMLVPIARPATPPPRAEMTLASLATGIRFVGRTQELLASITLDLFAVLLGGATTLLPVFAKDILHVGPRELGWMLAAPSFGALVMALALAYRRTMRRAGRCCCGRSRRSAWRRSCSVCRARSGCRWAC